MSATAPWARAAPCRGSPRRFPQSAGLLNARIGAAHALGTMARIASVIANASPDRITASAGVRSGLVNQAGTAEPERAPIHSAGVGSVPYLRIGEEVKRIQTGPDETSRKYEGQLEKDVSSALNMPLSELLSDYSSGSFSNSPHGLGRRPGRENTAPPMVGTGTTAFRSISKPFPTPSRRDACRA